MSSVVRRDLSIFKWKIRRSEGKPRTTSRCQQICNRRAEYSARNLEKMSNRPRYISHWKLDQKRKVFSFWRNLDSDEAAVTEEGKPFHALDAASGSARSPSVERFVGATTNVSETVERIDGDDRQRQRFDGGWRQDVGAVLWRQRSTKTHSRNRIRSRIHSQWSSWSNGDTWSDFLAEKTAWAVHSGLTEKA